MRVSLFNETVLLVLVFGCAAAADTLPVNAHLSGRDEIPLSAVRGAGELKGQVDTETKLFSYRVTYKGLTGPATAARIHGPARRGKLGSPIFGV